MTKWSYEHKVIALELKNNGKSHKEIAIKMELTAKEIESLIDSAKYEQKNKFKMTAIKEQNELRMKCYENGMTDCEAAQKCGISRKTYSSWRLYRGLPGNFYEHAMTAMPKKHKPVKHERVVLTNADLQYYHHNDNSRRFEGGIDCARY